VPAIAEAVTADEQPRLAEFLRSIFDVRPDAPFLHPQLLRWKYFEPRPDWNGPRSWAVRDDSGIAAHVGVWPLGFVTPSGPVDSLHLIDWAASPRSPGSGILIYRELMKRATAVLAVGGSAEARKILGKIGFSQVGELTFYARAARPWKQFRARAAGWKDAARLLRNVAWKWTAGGAADGRWRAEPVRSFPDSLRSVLPDGSSAAFTASSRSVELLNYFLRCPNASCRGFVLSRDGTPAGYFLLSLLGGQARIADLWVLSENHEDWAAGFALASRAAAADPAACEIVAVASTQFAGQALRDAGFRSRFAKPLWLHDPRRRLRDLPPIHIQQVESDAFFLHDPAAPFLT
jgi:hypothetical protein